MMEWDCRVGNRLKTQELAVEANRFLEYRVKKLKIFFVIGWALTFLSLQAQADPKSRTSVTQTSPNHTEIIIHDYSPEAKRARRRHLENARRLRELKERRAHELELARIRASSGSRRSVSIDLPANSSSVTSRADRSDTLASIRERQRRNAYKPPAFFNGGRFTGVAYGSFGNFGFPAGFNSGYRFNFQRGFRRSYRPSIRCRPVRRSYRAPRVRRGRCR